MATRKFLGQAPAVKQVRRYTPSSVSIGQTFILTCNSKTVTFIATTTNVADVTAGLLALLTSSTAPPPPEFLEVTWTDSGTYLQGTASTAGKPFTITSSSGTGTLTASTVTASSGPNDISVSYNWSSNTVPSNNDTIIFENSNVDVLYGISQSGITGVNMIVDSSFGGSFGLPEITSTGYAEYRGTYLAYGFASIIYAGTGSRAKFDAGSTSCVATINNSGSSPETGIESVLIKGSALTINANKGSVGVAVFASETANAQVVKLGTLGSVSVRLGSGCVANAVTVNGGTFQANQNLTTLTVQSGGVATQNLQNGTVTTLVNAGTYIHNSNGTITTYTAIGRGQLEASQSLRTFTITNSSLMSGCGINDPFGRITFTNPIQLNQCRLGDVRIDVGVNRTLAIA
jgi:hypothetical protein